MEDEELTQLTNLCADLVSVKRWESFVIHLLTRKRTAEWVRVCEHCVQAGVDAGEVKSDLFVSWLPDPTAEEGYAVIVFYDEESMWTMAARYNRQRLLDAVPTLAGRSEEV
jgi:hypothetical protein